ncbi:hypothetical protein [Paludibaculum fermentans]|uniref:Lipocalin-like domain-containing protein n=1 Tax=Paludibaculum fermentans TaxID=1473598 RepID=A0A7S7SMZ0_PALFE|nr:hypothetical protein [Paludibaculum fermentans]QOY90924.1 hypothetical protein IRI77_13545 [Paludibaculum fermentans]
MRLLLLQLLLVSTAVVASAQDRVSLSGKWQVHLNVAGNESDQTCTLTQEGSDLTGTCDSDQATGKLAGKVADKTVAWTFKSEYNGAPLTIKYKGTLDGTSKITGSVLVEEYSVEGEFTATLAK